MRKLITGVLAVALALGLAVAQPAEAKVYKMKPEERAAALKEKKARKARAKKSRKAAEEAPGGWVEVKPGSKKAAAKGEKAEKSEKKSRKKVDEVAKAAEEKGRKGKRSKPAKAERVAEEKAAKATKTSRKKSRDRNVPAREAFRGDRGGARVSGSNAEVSRPGGPNLDSYSVSRPGYEKGAAPTAPGAPAPGTAAPVVPEVRHEVQPGPVDSSKPLGTEPVKGGEGRF